MAKEINVKELIGKIIPKTTTRRSHREINLVPDIKDEMIKTLKLRNLIFFICIVVASASVGTSLVFLSIAGGQQAAVDGKKNMLADLSKKLGSYSDLSNFLTIKDQLGNLAEISNNKKLFSRTFNVIATLLPNTEGTIQISELNVNLSGEPTFSFDAQADAPGGDDGIDYNVLDSFKKSMQYFHYDYGRYVDKEGAEIPAYCIIENGTDGATLHDENNNYYAYWLINGEGCNPSAPETDDEDDSSTNNSNNSNNSSNSNNPNSSNSNTSDTDTDTSADTTTPTTINGYAVEQYEGQSVVRIWRTPQYESWYKNKYLTLDGTISDVPHFESQCTTYQGVEVETTVNTDRGTKKTTRIDWTPQYSDSCLLVPDGQNGINITDSSNGRGADDALVLRFSAIITLNSEIFKFNNHHLIAIPPAGRFNVTDSYTQIQNIFAERAADCAPGDTACSNNTRNEGGN